MKNKPYPLYDVPYTATFREFLTFCEQSYSDQIAFSYHRRKELVQKTYRQFVGEVMDLGMCFLSKGYQECKIAVMGENSYEWLLTYFATVTTGNVIVPIDKSLPTEQVCFILRETEAKLLIISDSYKDYVEAVQQSGIQIDVASLQSEISKWVGIGKEEANRTNGMQRYDMSAPSPNDLAAIAYTSGTTGTAKGVMLTHRNLCMNCVGGIRNQHFHTKTIVVLPLHHTFAVLGLMCTLMNGCHEYIGSLKNISKDMKEQQPYSLILVPMMVEAFYKAIWNNAEENGKDKALRKLISLSNFLLRLGIDLRRKLFKTVLDGFGGNLELIISGGAPLDKRYISDFRAFGIQIAEGYGITECAPLVAVNRILHYRDGSVGLPIFNADVKISNAGNNAEGEICVKGECVFKGYWNAPDLTAEAFDEDRYFKTGDVGYMDEDGFVYITGRIKNIIILANGKNVYPEELEFEWMKHPAVKEVLVYEKDDAIAAEILPDAEYFNANPADLDTFFADALAEFNHRQPPHKNISQVILRDTPFPKTTSMKIKRNYNN